MLPRGDENRPVQTSEHRMLPETQQASATILIIDDEPIQLRAIVAELNALGFEAGCVDYITKPFDQREVLARVSAHLQQQHLFARMAEQVEPSRQGRAPLSGRNDAVAGEPADEMGLRFVYRAIDILLDEMADPPGLIELAHRIGTNQARLGREFQTHLGMSPFEYLREQRLVRAQELLATTDRQIQQIADTIGFRRAGDFATAFRLRFGMTPREYRKRHG